MPKKPSFGEAINELHHLVNLYYTLWDEGYIGDDGEMIKDIDLDDLPDEFDCMSFDTIEEVSSMICKANLGTQCRKMLDSIKE